jgi:hypothetical protein
VICFDEAFPSFCSRNNNRTTTLTHSYRLLHSHAYAPAPGSPAVGGEMHLADPARHLAYRDAFVKVSMAALDLKGEGDEAPMAVS